jgi:hypothetical protein
MIRLGNEQIIRRDFRGIIYLDEFCPISKNSNFNLSAIYLRSKLPKLNDIPACMFIDK